MNHSLQFQRLWKLLSIMILPCRKHASQVIYHVLHLPEFYYYFIFPDKLNYLFGGSLGSEIGWKLEVAAQQWRQMYGTLSCPSDSQDLSPTWRQELDGLLK